MRSGRVVREWRFKPSAGGLGEGLCPLRRGAIRGRWEELGGPQSTVDMIRRDSKFVECLGNFLVRLHTQSFGGQAPSTIQKPDGLASPQ